MSSDQIYSAVGFLVFGIVMVAIGIRLGWCFMRANQAQSDHTQRFYRDVAVNDVADMSTDGDDHDV